MAINNEISPSNPLNNAVYDTNPPAISRDFIIPDGFVSFFKLYYVETHNRRPSDTAHVDHPSAYNQGGRTKS